MTARSLRGAGLVLATAVALSACGAPAAPRPTPDVAILVANVNLNFSQEMGAGFAAATAQSGVRTQVVGPEIVDGPREVQQFGELLDGHTAGISLCTLQPDLFVESLSRAAAAGIPVIAVDNPLPVGSGVSLFVGNDNVELGRLLADQVIDQLPPDAHGTVVIGTSSPGAPVLDRRADGIRQQFGTRRPGVRVLGPFDSKQEVSANLAAWRTLVAARPDDLPTGWVYVPGLAVTPRNVDGVIARQASAESRRAALMQVDRVLGDLPDHIRQLADVGSAVW